VTLIQHSHDFLTEPHGGADFMVRLPMLYRFGCVVMTTAGLKSSQRTKAIRVSLPLAMSALSLPTSQASTSNRVTDEAHFTEASWGLSD
jgi:flagellar biosynthesis protein FliR